CQKYNRSPLTF
nr:immunoglobulin light chain junction region [Macaca mulatta]